MNETDVFNALKYRTYDAEERAYFWSNSDGQWHRTDGPAVEYDSGTKMWYQNGQLHRLDGPAIEKANGEKWWYQNYELHRTDGPAIEYADGDRYWWIDGEEYTEDEFNKRTKL